MIDELLKARNLPGGDWDRSRLIDLFSRHVFGKTPAAPAHVDCEVLSRTEAWAGKALQEEWKLTWETPGGTFSLPVYYACPHAQGACPAFVLINFRPDVPDQYMPTEEILDAGYAIARIYYKDVTDDSAKMDKLAALYPAEGDDAWGKIGMWAFACSRVLDVLLTRPEIDGSRVAVIGHSRLGKTALWCGAQDERFSLVISNDSGCSGAAITRGKVGESLARITEVFPYWFCRKYLTYANRESDLPVEHHQLVGLMAPRCVCVGSAAEDTWADPESEFLSCCAATQAYDAQGLTGLVTPDRLPHVGEALQAGRIGYHLRQGAHFLSRTDWQRYMEYRRIHNV